LTWINPYLKAIRRLLVDLNRQNLVSPARRSAHDTQVLDAACMPS
jgi:hypothetical protein